MNFTTFSPALALLYVWILLWILMDVSFKKFDRAQQCCIVLLFLIIAAGNHMLRLYMGADAYGKLLFFTMHLPTFLVFLFLAGRGIIKTGFMILTALVFTAPAILIGNLIRRKLFVGSSVALLLTNLVSYGILLLIAYVVFRRGFHYLLKYAENRLFLFFSLIPLLYYLYAMAVVNVDFSQFTSFSGLVMRALPSGEAFLFYFLLLYIYRNLSEKQEMTVSQAALSQEFAYAEERIHLLNETQRKMAVYQHDMRHQLIVLEGLLAAGKPEQAQEFIQKIQKDLEEITPRRFCENDIVNLLCSSFSGKAEKMGVKLTVEAKLPKELPVSDTELCSLLSNGLENALAAATALPEGKKWVKLYCDIRFNKLLIEVQNSHLGEVTMRDGLPVSNREGHGYGCRSICIIVEQHHGLCTFEAETGVFTMRVMLPM